MRCAIVIEGGENSFGAYVPDLPGCVAAAASRREAAELIGEAVDGHLAVPREQGLSLPEPHSESDYVEI